ncbi:MAG: mechanosensitive ion channel [Pseudanabaenaceae cyanobacterium]|jgi:hypothetical protein
MHNISHFIDGQWLLAQASPVVAPTAGKPFAIEDLLKPDGFVVQFAIAIAILVGGWFISVLVSRAVSGILAKTGLDKRVSQLLTGGRGGMNLPVEKWVGSLVFWLLFLFTLLTFFQFLKLEAVTKPLNSLLDQITGFVPKFGAAASLAAVAWLLASVSQTLLSKSLKAAKIDEKLGEQVTETSTDESGDVSAPVTTDNDNISLSDTLSSAVYWFVWLLFLPMILESLGLSQALQPLQNLINQILSALPKIIKAVLIGGVGWLVANVVRKIVSSFLAASGVDRLLAQWTKQSNSDKTYALSQVVGTAVYALILIPTVIASLEALEVAAISRPATMMLDRVLSYLPQISSAVLIVIVSYLVGQFLRDIVTSVLTGLGFDNVLKWLGFESIVAEPTDSNTPEADQAAGSAITKQTPSQIVGILALISIMLVAVSAATDILQIPALTRIVVGILQVSSQIFSGVVVFAIGLYLANFAYKLISSGGGRQARILGHTARISIIALITAMALKQMGIASNIVDLAFGLLVGAIAVAIALAFGFGGKDIAGEQLRNWLDSFKRND